MSERGDAGGGVTLVGAQIDAFRFRFLLRGLDMELNHGMRLTAKAPTCYSILKREYGFKGSRKRVMDEATEAFGAWKAWMETDSAVTGNQDEESV